MQGVITCKRAMVDPYFSRNPLLSHAEQKLIVAERLMAQNQPRFIMLPHKPPELKIVLEPLNTQITDHLVAAQEESAPKQPHKRTVSFFCLSEG